MPTKAKAIALRNPYFSFLGLVKGEVNFRVKGRVVGKVVDGWRHYPVFKGQYSCNSLNRACRTQQMAGHRFGGTDIYAVNIIAENIFYRFYFLRVAYRGRCSMNIHIVDIGGG